MPATPEQLASQQSEDRGRIAAYIESLRRRLIDLTGRNRLISFRPQRRSSLEILYPDIPAIWQRLLGDEKSWRFIPGLVSDEDDEEPSAVELTPQDCCSMAEKGRLAVNLQAEKLETGARYIRRQADEVTDETGTNHLFLALGFLKWFERNDSETERLSPLLLVPVNIHEFKSTGEESRRYFDIQHDGAEISENLSLKLRIEEDFGLSLPVVKEGEDPDAYLRKVEELIGGKERWMVVRNAHLAFFSFAKLRMYQDLDPAAWPDGRSLLDNSLIRALLDGSEKEDESPIYGSVEVHDEHTTAHEIPLVCEADSSQHTAILKVVEGRNTVIEGPPGTGKSQTITNIVAAVIAAGKTVLFLSEKSAALTVVKDNLEHRGLGDFCLEMHSNKSRRDAVHASIKKRVSRQFPWPQTIAETRNQWKELQNGLVQYMKAAGAAGGPWSEPLYSCFGRAIALREQHLPSLRTVFSGDMPDGAALATRMEFLRTFAEHLHNPEVFRDHPWSGFRPTEANPGDEAPICELFDKILRHVRRLRTIECDLTSETGVQDCLPPAIVERALLYFPSHLTELTNGVHGEALQTFHRQEAFDHTRHILTIHDEYFIQRELAVRALSDSASDDGDLAKWLEGTAVEINRLGLDQASIEELLRQAPAMVEAADIFGQLGRIAARLEELGLGKARSLGDLRRLQPTLAIASTAPSSISKFLGESLLFPSALDALKAALQQSKILVARANELAQTFVVGDVPAPAVVNEHRKQLRATGGSFFSFFNKNYRVTRQAVLSYLQSRKSFRFPNILESLEKLELWQHAVTDFTAEASYKQSLGRGFQGQDTDWEQLEAVISWCQSVAVAGLPYSVVEKIQSDGTQFELKRLSAELNQNLERLHRVHQEAEKVLLAALGVMNSDSVSVEKTPEFLAEWSVWFRDSLGRTRELVRSTVLTFAQIRISARAALTAIDHAREIEQDSKFCSTFGALAKGLDSDWDSIEKTLKWCEAVREISLPADLQDWLFDPMFQIRLPRFLEVFREVVDEGKVIEDVLTALQGYGPLQRDWFFGSPRWTWREMVSRCERLTDATHLIPQWVIHQKLRANAEAYGVTLFSDRAIDGHFPVESMSSVYALTVAEQHGYSCMGGQQNLATFSHRAHEATRQRFAEVDRKLLELNRRSVASMAAKRATPSGNGVGPISGWTENSLLQREMEKQKAHIPIRQLMLRATAAIRALKPCIMMSPLSVAQYLDPSLPPFDLVVMDEASQIRPEDALGAVARAKQLVVVGDTKQMPPSSLWQTQIDRDGDDDEDEISAAEDAESVLECALHSFHPVYRLKWHYRSLHEDLIKFSNFHYYDNELVIFPCAKSTDERLGIRFHAIPNGAFVNRHNDVEARVVAEAAVRHLMQKPQESLLIATMNRHQQELIEEWIDRITESDAVARDIVEEAKSRDFEKFLIRNLENVQGDQRDVVFISFTYGKDPSSGRVAQRFGPINGKSGRRRLNVLFSRAKMRVEAFSSMTFQDVVGVPGQQSGVNDLRDYLRFAQDGVLYEQGEHTGKEPDSDFEVAVMNVIRSAGLVPVPQVGVASYRIDIGVCRPGRAGEYILGIECDGATYHSSKSARDRDRIRHEILVSRGWKLYRIWSTDWFRQHDAAKSRLLDALRTAGDSAPLLGDEPVVSESGPDDDTPVVTGVVTLSKIAAATALSISEVRSLAWRAAWYCGEDDERIARQETRKIAKLIRFRVQ